MKKKKTGFLGTVEKVGNFLPHPAIIFVILCAIIAVISHIMAKNGVSVQYTGLDRNTNEIKDMTATAVSLLDPEGIRYMFTSAVKNFTSFAPLGTVLVALLGVGVAEGTGLIGACLTKLVTSTPKKLITLVVVFAGVMSSIASDAGYVVLIPLGAVIFMSFGRHPMAGIAAAFAGVSGGYSANLLVGPTDALLAGITTEAAKLSSNPVTVGVTDNWWFIIASTFLITIIGTFVTEKIVEPRLGKYKGNSNEVLTTISDNEKRGLKFAGITLVVFLALLALTIVPAKGVLRGPDTTIELDRAKVEENNVAIGTVENAIKELDLTIEKIAVDQKKPVITLRTKESIESADVFNNIQIDTEDGSKVILGDIAKVELAGQILKSPFMDSIVVIIALMFLVPGIAYGYGARTIKKSDQIITLMGKSMAAMGGYVVLVFFAAQFVNYFTYTNIGTVVAVNGANFLENIGLTGIPLILAFILVAAFINIFMGSASAKWAIMAPIFVPMLLELGYSPALTQMAYRIGDSTTNLISPLMSYFALVVAFSQKYDEEAGAGTIISTMLPYSIAFLLGWSLLLILWFVFKLPLGPGVMIGM